MITTFCHSNIMENNYCLINSFQRIHIKLLNARCNYHEANQTQSSHKISRLLHLAHHAFCLWVFVRFNRKIPLPDALSEKIPLCGVLGDYFKYARALSILFARGMPPKDGDKDAVITLYGLCVYYVCLVTCFCDYRYREYN